MNQKYFKNYHFCGAHFYNPKEQYFVTTNLKVMYSNLNRQRDLKIVNPKQVAKNALLNTVSNGKPHYMLVRQVEERLKSFYKNKFIRGITHRKIQNKENFQHCIQIFFPYADVLPEDDIATIKEKISRIDYNSMIEILPKVYTKDAHIYPQFWCRKFRYKGAIIHINFDRIFNISQPKSLQNMFQILHLDNSIVSNSTRHLEVDLNFNNRSKTIIQQLYNKDFKLLSNAE